MADTSKNLELKLQTVAESVLQPGEELGGCLIGTQSGMFKGGMRAVVVTPQRLAIVPLDRKFQIKGDVVSVTPEDIADVTATGLGGGWYNTAISIAEWAGIDLVIKTVDGRRIKISMMNGEGGLIGRLGGGEYQRRGVEALKLWLDSLPH